ncbi:MAG: CPBP family intramembrane metalloprotease [Gemmataceae bacterium]|nr:CPBP family intramembrane metalloprotease [Gemmataceae bacterium]
MPWTGFEVFVAFVAFVVGLDLLRLAVVEGLTRGGFYQAVYGPPDDAGGYPDTTRQLMQMWGYAVAVPAFLGLAAVVRSALYPARHTSRVLPAPAVTVAVAGWLAFSLATLLVHFGVMFVFNALGWPIEEHPLARPDTYRTPLDRALFAVQACVLAPAIEEVMFRGVLLPWLLGRAHRVWPVLGIAVVVAVAAVAQQSRVEAFVRGPVLFAIGLVGGWVVLSRALRRKVRTTGAVYASAALFAVVHSGVWPSPVPLFVLGLGLGWLAVRTRGVFAPIVVHGLFNAVSVLFVLWAG